MILPRRLVATFSLLFTAAAPAFGASATWSSTPATGNFATGSNWVGNPSTGPGSTTTTGTNTDIATYNTTSTFQTGTLSSSRNLGGFLFDSGTVGSYNITSTSSNRFFLTRGGTTQMTSTVAVNETISAYIRIAAGISGNNEYTFANYSASGTSAIFTLGAIRNDSGTATTVYLRGSNTGVNSVGGVIDETLASNPLSIIKEDAGTWSLDAANSYTGSTTLNAGTLGVGSSTALGSGTLTINGGALAANTTSRAIANAVIVGGNFTLGGLANSITLNGTIDLGGTNRSITLGNSATFGGAVSNGGFTLESTSATRSLTLSGTNSLSGGVTINNGTIVLNNAFALGGTTGQITVNGGTLNLNGQNVTLSTLSGTGGTVSTGTTAGTTTLTLNSSNNATFGGTIADNASGVVALVKNGTGAITLSGNTFSGGLTLNSGTVELKSNSALGSGPVTINGGVIGSATSARTLSNAFSIAANFTAGIGDQSTILNGAVDLNSGTRTISLANSLTLNGAVSNGGITAQNSTSTVRNLTIGGTASYTGATTVAGSNLIVNGQLTGSTITVNAGSLHGNGLAGTVGIQGGATVGAGALSATGTLSMGSLTIASSGTVEAQYNSTTGAVDTLNVTDLNLDLSNGSILSVTDLGASSLALGTAWTIIDYSGAWNGGLFAGLADDSSFTAGSNIFQISYNGLNNADTAVTLYVIPEPGTAWMLLSGFAAFVAIRSRSRRTT